ncbi:hypothetical protein [Streptomyces sp. YU58]|uniref:hypothetical protein n=1 Tax=Streptomyces sp. SX92 TaxID=3158972 RepID=UPI0027B88257|nr:hypothetical protein [Streptomyces coralus]
MSRKLEAALAAHRPHQLFVGDVPVRHVRHRPVDACEALGEDQGRVLDLVT